jgi:multidrug resistance efflux pump
MEDKKEHAAPAGIMDRLKIDPSKVKYILSGFAVVILIIGGYYLYSVSQRIYTDKAEIYAPLITLSSGEASILQKVLVKEGDKVVANQTVAIMDRSNLVIDKEDGVVVNINNQVGKLFSPGEAIVTMINPEELRLIAHIPENKGINEINVGQKVIFTVDAYGSREFTGEVEEISQSSDQSSVVFSISDKRDIKNFSVKIKYSGYSELLNGMSAKAWIYKK